MVERAGKFVEVSDGAWKCYPSFNEYLYERESTPAPFIAPEAAAYASIIDYYANFSFGYSDYEDACYLTDCLTYELNLDKRDDEGQRAYELSCSTSEAAYERNIGYAIQDINDDGIPELILLADDEYVWPHFIYAIYTLHQDSPVLAGAYWSRNQCELDKSGRLYVEGSNGAADNIFEVLWLNAESGEFEEVNSSRLPTVSKEIELVFIPFQPQEIG